MNRNSTKNTQSTSNTLDDLFEKSLLDIFSAEKQLVNALPLLAKAADNEDLEEAFQDHLEETKKQVTRLEKIMDRLSIEESEEVECEAMKGLIEEAQEIIDEFEEGPVKDAALIIAAQKVEHYEIAAYGSLRELADVLGLKKESDLLDRSLEEEGKADHKLSKLAMEINDYALEESENT